MKKSLKTTKQKTKRRLPKIDWQRVLISIVFAISMFLIAASYSKTYDLNKTEKRIDKKARKLQR